MKIIISIFLLFTTFVNNVEKKGEFKFDQETHNFGKVKISSEVTTIFTFTNIGEKPIIIFDVKPACGCTIADFSKNPVRKNQKGYIKITFHARVKQEFNKAISINSNAATPVKNLTIIGSVY